ncbi:unnamed protein product [Heligmosomoides polygyrus]|uniref:Secreted protein n=1 Tax=Heligmosomoides polygyrus TaxID=6339 RepID=A0A183FB19_HELPZ|nr:unnamed protein product [Heligmosomoides polygyrus]
MQSSAASAMQRAAHLLSLLCVVWRTSTAETGLRIPFSSQGNSAEADSIHRALFGSQEARTSVDIAVPQEQRLFGREPRGDIVTRPVSA